MESEWPRKEFTAHGRGQNKNSEEAVFLHALRRSPFLRAVGVGPGVLAALPGGAFEIQGSKWRGSELVFRFFLLPDSASQPCTQYCPCANLGVLSVGEP